MLEIAKSAMPSGEGIDKVYGTHYHTWLSAVAICWSVCGVDYTLGDGNYDPLAILLLSCYQGSRGRRSRAWNTRDT